MLSEALIEYVIKQIRRKGKIKVNKKAYLKSVASRDPKKAKMY